MIIVYVNLNVAGKMGILIAKFDRIPDIQAEHECNNLNFEENHCFREWKSHQEVWHIEYDASLCLSIRFDDFFRNICETTTYDPHDEKTHVEARKEFDEMCQWLLKLMYEPTKFSQKTQKLWPKIFEILFFVFLGWFYDWGDWYFLWCKNCSWSD